MVQLVRAPWSERSFDRRAFLAFALRVPVVVYLASVVSWAVAERSDAVAHVAHGQYCRVRGRYPVGRGYSWTACSCSDTHGRRASHRLRT